MPVSRNHRHKRMKAMASLAIRQVLGREGHPKVKAGDHAMGRDSHGVRRDISLTATKGWRNFRIAG